MSSLRWILLILGIFLILGIYLFETRRSVKIRDAHNKTKDPVFEDSHPEPTAMDEFPEDESAFRDAVQTLDETSELELSELTELIRSAINPLDDEPLATTRSEIRSRDVPANKAADPEKTVYLINGSIVVLHLLAHHPDGMHGLAIRKIFSELNIQHGRKNIFHYYHENDDVLFSIANLVEPGIFDLSAMDTFRTPGLTVFMLLDNLLNPRQAFETLLQIVWKLSGRLDARICDARRAPINQQTMADMLEEVKAYQLGR